jgi:hypothetical protein
MENSFLEEWKKSKQSYIPMNPNYIVKGDGTGLSADYSKPRTMVDDMIADRLRQTASDAKEFSHSDVMMFCGYLSGHFTELHNVEVPRIGDAWNEFKEKLEDMRYKEAVARGFTGADTENLSADGTHKRSSEVKDTVEITYSNLPLNPNEPLAWPHGGFKPKCDAHQYPYFTELKSEPALDNEESFWQEVFLMHCKYETKRTDLPPDQEADKALAAFRARFRDQLPTMYIQEARKVMWELIEQDLADGHGPYLDMTAMTFHDFMKSKKFLRSEYLEKETRDEFAKCLLTELFKPKE